MQPESPHPFEALTPELILDAVEKQGFVCDGRLVALNSYENRVYQLGIEEREPIVAKFYRPARWSDAQIIEEHEFCFELAEHELPVVAPLTDAQGESLFHHEDFRVALYPRRGGHAPEFDNLDNLLTMGRMLGRIHLIGASRPFRHRPRLDSADFGHDSVSFLGDRFIPAHLQPAYETLTADLLQAVDAITTQTEDVGYIRVHGDCHAGNILWRDEAPHFVDFDDARMAPAVQDVWMLLSGERPRRSAQIAKILEGYSQFHDFSLRELRLVEVLRTLRMLHYSAWLARRWDDPAFPRNFPWFNTTGYWENHILELREQYAALHEPPLSVTGDA
jgi:Ser/Thr protein kinase RdoA (MazF antagonist)